MKFAGALGICYMLTPLLAQVAPPRCCMPDTLEGYLGNSGLVFCQPGTNLGKRATKVGSTYSDSMRYKNVNLVVFMVTTGTVIIPFHSAVSKLSVLIPFMPE